MSAIRSNPLPPVPSSAEVPPLVYPGGAVDDRLDQAEALLEHFEKLEQRFNEVRRHLTRSHRLTTLGTLASIIAHEYNNILTPMLSYAQMALADPDNADLTRKALEKSLAGAERAAKVSSSILGFTREHDSRKTSPLRQTIDDAVATLARPPQRDGIELTIDVPDVDAAIDPLSLQQVLVNLLLNARRAMRKSGGAVTIRGDVRCLMVDGRCEDQQPANIAHRPSSIVHLRVSDTGPGIPDDIRDRLFEPFVTRSVADGDGSDGERGTGLGLCICRDLIAAAGGTIRVESIPAPQANHGATFHIELPVTESRRGGDIQST